MKLDSIIYDVDTLQSALIQKTVEESPTFNAMYPSDTATSLMTVLSGYGSMLQYELVSAMANCYTDTVYSEAGIHQLAETLGNKLHGNVSSSVNVYVERKNLLGVTNVNIPANCAWDAEGIKFYNPLPITFTNENKKQITLKQGEYKTHKTTVNGLAGERIYFSQDFKCDMDSVVVLVNGEEWETSETFLPLNANNLIDNTEMQSVILRTDPDGRTYIKFGNNTTGLLPPAGSVVEIHYVSNEGEDGNIASDAINISLVTPIYHYYEGNNIPLEVECQNTTVAAGGFNTQSLEVLKETSPFVFASGNRAISRDDYKALLINKCGYKTANVWGEYEESVFNGYYDKSMMNTVYYTGIKQLQHYDYKPLGEITKIEYAGEDLLDNPYTDDSLHIGTIKGFPGSYSIDFIYKLDQSIRMRYRDRFGTGILTCDPSVNKNDDNLFPFNDIGNSLVQATPRVTLKKNKVHVEDYTKLNDDGTREDLSNQEIMINRISKNVNSLVLDEFGSSDPESRLREWTGDINTVLKYHVDRDQPVEPTSDSNDFTFFWDGFNSDNRAKNLSFTSPFRIYFEFSDNCPTPISAISFRAPRTLELLKHCPGKFALYGTNESESVAPIDRVRNNINWKRIIDVNKIEFNITRTNHSWSDWYTTNLYQPNKTITTEELNAGITVLFDEWQSYKRYVLEVYSLQDESIQGYGQFMIIPGIRMLYANNNEDYYGWVYDEDIEDNKTDWEPNVAYLLLASASGDAGDRQTLLVKDDASTYPDKYFHVENVDHYYLYDVTFDGSDMYGYGVDEIITIPGDSGDTAAKFKITSVTHGDPDPLKNGKITGVSIVDVGKFSDDITGTLQRDQYTYGGTGTGAIFTIRSYPYKIRYYYSQTEYYDRLERIGVTLHRDKWNGTDWVIDQDYEDSTEDNHQLERYFRVATVQENLDIHKGKGVSYINYENNDLVSLRVPAFPKDMKYYIYNVEVVGAGLQNGYKTGQRLYWEQPTTDGTGSSFFHVVIQNASANNGNGKTLVYYSKSKQNSVTNLPLADNTLIESGEDGYPLQNMSEDDKGEGAKIKISSIPAIEIFANMTGNSYTLSQTQGLDNPIIDEYNHFTTYVEFKQPRIKHVSVSVTVEYEQNVNTNEVEINIRKALTDVFAITPYFIGQSIPINILWKAVQSVKGIKRFVVTAPLEDINCELNELLILNESDININTFVTTTEFK